MPPEVVETLKTLSRDDFDMLATEVAGLQHAERQGRLPTDPGEAVGGRWDALRRGVPLGVEEPLQEIGDALELACLILGRGDDLDAPDGLALWSLMDRARVLLRWERERQKEVRARLWQIRQNRGQDITAALKP